MTAALDGVTVLAIEQAVAVPFATRQLADLGARVIKVERRGDGDFARHYDTRANGLSSYFAWLNRTKESITLDLTTRDGVAIVRHLASISDVVVQNLAPGATQRLGIDSASLRAEHPELITVDLTGYGTGGPYEGRKAYDLLVQAEAGLLSVTGTEDMTVRAGISAADIAGGMYVYSSVLAALVHRWRTGEGTAIEVSLFDALTEWMGHPIHYAMYSGEAPPRAGDSHPTIYPYGSFATADGRVQFGIQNEREWMSFCMTVLDRHGVAGDPRFADNAARSRHRVELAAEIEEVFAALSTSDVIARLDAAGIANGRVNDVTALIQHPQLATRDRWREVATASGPIKALRPPAIMHGLDEPMGPIPEVGEHTEAILAELGYDREQIERWRADSVI
ncbi:MAG: CaiB/BaiF CoA-transferase family protein [Actinomycetota bacterium]|nr:CaiB/BaiF CoA-transferase family protein [Actinomycetota bacterium]